MKDSQQHMCKTCLVRRGCLHHQGPGKGFGTETSKTDEKTKKATKETSLMLFSFSPFGSTGI
jgi:hypothetical protein